MSLVIHVDRIEIGAHMYIKGVRVYRSIFCCVRLNVEVHMDNNDITFTIEIVDHGYRYISSVFFIKYILQNIGRQVG